METFKLVVDGIDLSKQDRERIESRMEKAMLEVLAGRLDGMKLFPIAHPEGVPKLTHGMPNGGILISLALAEKELPQLLESQFGPEAEVADVRVDRGLAGGLDASRIVERAGLENLADRGKLSGPGGAG